MAAGLLGEEGGEGREGKRWEGELERKGMGGGQGKELRDEQGASWVGQGTRASSYPA